jgi:hypothetical protein
VLLGDVAGVLLGDRGADLEAVGIELGGDGAAGHLPASRYEHLGDVPLAGDVQLELDHPTVRGPEEHTARRKLLTAVSV